MVEEKGGGELSSSVVVRYEKRGGEDLRTLMPKEKSALLSNRGTQQEKKKGVPRFEGGGDLEFSRFHQINNEKRGKKADLSGSLYGGGRRESGGEFVNLPQDHNCMRGDPSEERFHTLGRGEGDALFESS